MSAPGPSATLANLDEAHGLSHEVREHVAFLTLDVPPGNRFSLRLQRHLASVADALLVNDDVRAVLLTAAGPDFSQGADLKDAEMASEVMSGRDGALALARLGQGLIDTWARLPMPTVVAARGHVVGAAACIFTASDFRFAAPDTQLRFPEVDRGMHLSWGILPRLAHEFGPAIARRLTVAAEAFAVDDLPRGSVRIVDDGALEEAARTLADELATKPPLAVRAILSVFRHADREQASSAASDPELFADTVLSEDFVEAIRAWTDKRGPKFRGR